MPTMHQPKNTPKPTMQTMQRNTKRAKMKLELKSIKITKKTKEALDKKKIHPRQSYDETIKELLEKQQ